jgi:CTP synthase (UTP-ammonia lyase)
VLGIRDAEHEETAPKASRLVIQKLACSLAGKTETIKIIPGTLAHRLYGKEETTEQFRCNYGLNPDYQESIEKGGLRVSGIGPEGEARIVELPGHSFFMATLFLPQLASAPLLPHPLIIGYLRAVVANQAIAKRFLLRG